MSGETWKRCSFGRLQSDFEEVADVDVIRLLDGLRPCVTVSRDRRRGQKCARHQERGREGGNYVPAGAASVPHRHEHWFLVSLVGVYDVVQV